MKEIKKRGCGGLLFKLFFLVLVLVLFAAGIILLSPYAQACAGPYCTGNYNPSCTFHAYKDCLGNSVYWFNSCANPQDLFQSCSGANQICKYGQCVVLYNYVNHYRTSCFNNSLYWYDSQGSIQTLSESCADTNSCTEDTCTGSKCQNSLKCDGTTCAVGSQDYCNSCGRAGDNLCNQSASLNAGGTAQTDSATISLSPNQQTASVVSAPATLGFMDFLKRWYIWILVALVLIFLFVVIFRRLSREA